TLHGRRQRWRRERPSGHEADHRAPARRLGGRLELERCRPAPDQPRLQRRRAAQPVARPDRRQRRRPELPRDDSRADRSRRALLRWFVATNAATGLINVKALVYVDAFIPDEGDTLFSLVPDSCLAAPPAKVFNQVPVAGGVDLYLQTAP